MCYLLITYKYFDLYATFSIDFIVIYRNIHIFVP